MTDANLTEPLRIEKAVYGGDGLARRTDGEVVFVPFALPGELVGVGTTAGPPTSATVQVIECSRDRVAPQCAHFGVCGGCQYQMASYPAQLAMKQAILRETLERAGLSALPEIQAWGSPEDYGYRNRIRLRVRPHDGQMRVGYSVRGTKTFLPVTMCPIAAPLLWRAAEAILSRSQISRDLAAWIEAASELELFCEGAETRLQVTLLCAGKPPRDAGSFGRAMESLQLAVPELSGAGAVRLDVRSGRGMETYASWGAAGLAYPAAGETYWVTRGGFFQVNRFLLDRLVDLVGDARTGAMAWDLFAGVGLFSRGLARRFDAVTAVEANPVAAADLSRSLAKLGRQHRAVEATTIEFLRRAVLERNRPETIVLDPPRAGAGQEVCDLLVRLGAREIVYLSCDPTTLARDLDVLTRGGYRLQAVHLIDLFPQTYHLETLAILQRT